MNHPHRGQLPGLFSLLVVALLTAALLTGCVAKNPNPTPQTNHQLPTPTATATPGGSGGGTTSAHHAGDTITVQGVSCTLVSAAPIQGDANTAPDAGNIFVVVHVKIVNGSNAQFTATYLDFSTSSNGDTHSMETIPPSTYTANNILANIDLQPGGSVEGDMIFQVAQGDHNAMLVWNPPAFGDTNYTWNLGL